MPGAAAAAAVVAAAAAAVAAAAAAAPDSRFWWGCCIYWHFLCRVDLGHLAIPYVRCLFISAMLSSGKRQKGPGRVSILLSLLACARASLPVSYQAILCLSLSICWFGSFYFLVSPYVSFYLLSAAAAPIAAAAATPAAAAAAAAASPMHLRHGAFPVSEWRTYSMPNALVVSL